MFILILLRFPSDKFFDTVFYQCLQEKKPLKTAKGRCVYSTNIPGGTKGSLGRFAQSNYIDLLVSSSQLTNSKVENKEVDWYGVVLFFVSSFTINELSIGEHFYEHSFDQIEVKHTSMHDEA